MGSSLTPGSAIITITHTLTEAGKQRDVTATTTIATITESDARVVTVPITEVDLITLTAAAVGKGQFGSYDFFTIINRDDTNFCRIRVREAGGDTADFRLDAGEWMTFWNSKIEVNTTAAAFGAFVDWDTIAVQADTAPVDLQYIAIAK